MSDNEYVTELDRIHIDELNKRVRSFNNFLEEQGQSEPHIEVFSKLLGDFETDWFVEQLIHHQVRTRNIIRVSRQELGDDDEVERHLSGWESEFNTLYSHMLSTN